MVSNGNKNSDYLIIGGGVIGMSIARELAQRGAGKITLIERGKLGQEASFAAAGMLTPQADAEKDDDLFRFCYESRGLYDDFAAQLKDESGIDIQLETSGAIAVAFSEADEQRLEKIYAWQHEAGLPVEKLSAARVLELEPNVSPDVRGGLYFPREAQVENRLLVTALAESLRRSGVEILENTEVITLESHGGKIADAITDKGNFSAPVIVLTTGAWSSFIKEQDRSLVDVFPVRGQMLSFAPQEKLFRYVIISSSGYLVPRSDNRVLVGATVENVGFDKSLTPEGEQFLLQSAYEIAPRLAKFEISDKWTGLRPCSLDKMPVIGGLKSVSGLFVATAHYRNGILLAPATAEAIADVILDDKANEATGAFGPERFLQAAMAG